MYSNKKNPERHSFKPKREVPLAGTRSTKKWIEMFTFSQSVCIYVIESKSPLKRKAWKFLATYISIHPITGTPTLGEGWGKEKNNVKARVP